MEREEFLSEGCLEVVPVHKIIYTGVGQKHFPVVYSGNPSLGTVSRHVSHGPLDFRLFIQKLIRSESEIGLTSMYEVFARNVVSVVQLRKRRSELWLERFCGWCYSRSLLFYMYRFKKCIYAWVINLRISDIFSCLLKSLASRSANRWSMDQSAAEAGSRKSLEVRSGEGASAGEAKISFMRAE